MGVLVKGENVSKVYKMGEVDIYALSSVSFEIYDSELLVILGPSGSGKSTLLNIVGGMDTLTSGELYYREKALHSGGRRLLTEYRRDAVGFVFQFYNLMPNLTAIENVDLAREISQSPLNAEQMLDSVGLLSCVFGVIAGYRGSKGAIKLSPAEAMREREPVTGSKSIFEKIPFILLIVTSRGKMALRNISRSPARSFFVLIGIAFTFALSVVPWTFMGQIDVMLFDRYDEVEKYDVRVYLSSMTPLERAEKELLRQEDVNLSEGILDISGFITNAHIREAVPITGLRRDNQLYTVLDDSKDRIYIEKGGIVLPRRVADRLNVKTGDKVTFESPYMRNKDEKEEIRVIDVIDQSVGINSYMEIEYLSDILGYPPAANSILLASREGVAESLKIVYEDSSVITGINDSNEMIEKMRQFLESYTGTMFYVALIAIIMGFAIVYNSYVIILSERKHELSSLMVLGMSEKEVLSIITFEQWFIAFFGMIFGIPLAQATITAIGEAASSDMFTMNIKIDLNSIIIAMIITVFSIVIAQIMASRKIKKLNIADALKSNE